jgi:PKD repeat protein
VNLLANWDMGDGSGMRIEWSPTHTYAQPGSYEVIMVVLAEDFSAWSSARQTVTVPTSPPPPPPPTGPTAAFTHTCTWLACTFTDASTAGSAAITSRSWSFGDGSPPESGTSVQHTFGGPGTYSVVLTVTDGNNLSDDETQSVPVQSAPTGPTAAFTYTCTWLACTFTDASTAGSGAITSRSWSFGDGSPAGSGTSVQHTFAGAGTYDVVLTVTDANGLSDDQSDPITVQAEPVISLSARGYKVKGRQTVELTWSGAQSARVVVLRNGAVVMALPNSTTESNTWTHSTDVRGGGTWTYSVCQADAGDNPTSVCSPNVQVVF